MDKKQYAIGSPISRFFKIKLKEIVSIIRIIRTIFIILFVVSIFALSFTFILYGLYKYFIPGLFVLAAGMILLPLFVYLFRRWKRVLLALFVVVTCCVLLFVTVWEIKDVLNEKQLSSDFFDPSGLIPIYSIMLTLILWIIVSIGSILLGNLDQSKGPSPFVKFLISFFKSYTTVLSKSFFIIILLQVFYAVYFQFKFRLYVYIFVIAIVLLFTLLEIFNVIRQNRKR